MYLASIELCPYIQEFGWLYDVGVHLTRFVRIHPSVTDEALSVAKINGHKAAPIQKV